MASTQEAEVPGHDVALDGDLVHACTFGLKVQGPKLINLLLELFSGTSRVHGRCRKVIWQSAAQLERFAVHRVLNAGQAA